MTEKPQKKEKKIKINLGEKRKRDETLEEKEEEEFTKLNNSNENKLVPLKCDKDELKSKEKNCTIYGKEIVKRIENIMDKINFIIDDNKTTTELQLNNISLFNKLMQVNKTLDDCKSNNINNQELKLEDGKYIGQVFEGKREGNGIMLFKNGSRYEGN